MNKEDSATEATELLTVDPDAPAVVSDGDFVIESGSPSFAAPPEDTTMETPAAPVVEPTDDESASTVPAVAAKPAAAAPAAPAGKKAKPPTLAEREATLKERVGKATFDLRETERKIAEANERLLERERRLAGAPPAGGPAPAAAAPPAAPVAPALKLPDPPDYRSFDSDEEYNAARTKYNADVNAAIAEHSEQLRQHLASSVDERLAGQTVERTMRDTLTRGQTKYPDWREKSDALKTVSSPWYDPARHGEARSPFLSDIAQTLITQGDDAGTDLLHWLGSDPERAQVLANLEPTRALRDALVTAPDIQPILEHFATDEGQIAFEAMKRMPPVRVFHAMGMLAARLAGASSGSPTAIAPITQAVPSARPPAGAPGAQAVPTAPAKKPFVDWMAEEDAKELAAKLKAQGIAV